MISLSMPTDVRAHVLDFQAKEKARKGLGHYSQQQAIITMLREHKMLTQGGAPAQQPPKIT